MFRRLLLQVGNEGLASEDDADTEEALKEFDFLVTAEDGEGAGEARSSGDGTEWGESHGTHSHLVAQFTIHLKMYRNIKFHVFPPCVPANHMLVFK